MTPLNLRPQGSFCYTFQGIEQSPVAPGYTATEQQIPLDFFSQKMPVVKNSEDEEMTEHEEKPQYAWDLSKNQIQECPRYKRSLDSIIPNLPAIPDCVRCSLTMDFTPCQYCPTVYLKDIAPHTTIRQKKYLAYKNAHPRDQHIVFAEEPHKYFINGSCEDILSVTTLVKSFFPQFDSRAQAIQTINSKTFAQTNHRKNYKYHGCKTPDDIIAKWNGMADLGTALHANIENYWNNEPYTVLPENEEPFRQFLELFKDENWANFSAFRCEWPVWDAETRVAGQIDFCGMVDPETKHIVLVDWKRSAQIGDCCFNRFIGKDPTMGMGVCSDLENSKFLAYSLQQNAYKFLLEKNYGFMVEKMFLVQLHPDLKKMGAAIYKCPNLQKPVEEMFATRKLAMKLKQQKQ